MSKTIDFTKLPVGTKVWDIGRGHGEINDLCHGDKLSVRVKFNAQSPWVEWFTFDGRIDTGHSQTLFLQPFDIVIPNEAYELESLPLPRLEVDDKILVKDREEDPWTQRHFHSWGFDGRVKVFAEGKTSWSDKNKDNIISWKMWKLP